MQLGLKTGSTSLALYNLSASATRNGLSLIAVIMKAPTTKLRFSEAQKLLDYGFNNYSYKELAKKDSIIKKVNITKGEDRMLNQFRKASFIDVGIVDYSGNVPQVLISNETRLVDAYLYPELVEVLDEKR